MCPQKFLQSARMNHCAACLRFLALVVTCSGARQAPCAVVANYPVRTVRLIVTFSAGNMTDIIARSIGLQGGPPTLGAHQEAASCLRRRVRPQERPQMAYGQRNSILRLLPWEERHLRVRR